VVVPDDDVIAGWPPSASARGALLISGQVSLPNSAAHNLNARVN
jgi:hypothetical protein